MCGPNNNALVLWFMVLVEQSLVALFTLSAAVTVKPSHHGSYT